MNIWRRILRKQEFILEKRVYPYLRFVKNDTKRAGTIGGFSEYILVPEAKLKHSLYFIPAEISDREASLIEPFTVGCRAARRLQPQKGEKQLYLDVEQLELQLQLR